MHIPASYYNCITKYLQCLVYRWAIKTSYKHFNDEMHQVTISGLDTGGVHPRTRSGHRSDFKQSMRIDPNFPEFV